MTTPEELEVLAVQPGQVGSAARVELRRRGLSRRRKNWFEW